MHVFGALVFQIVCLCWFVRHRALSWHVFCFAHVMCWLSPMIACFYASDMLDHDQYCTIGCTNMRLSSNYGALNSRIGSAGFFSTVLHTVISLVSRKWHSGDREIASIGWEPNSVVSYTTGANECLLRVARAVHSVLLTWHGMFISIFQYYSQMRNEKWEGV